MQIVANKVARSEGDRVATVIPPWNLFMQGNQYNLLYGM